LIGDESAEVREGVEKRETELGRGMQVPERGGGGGGWGSGSLGAGVRWGRAEAVVQERTVDPKKKFLMASSMRRVVNLFYKDV
jgi:hypothetical protein